MENYSDLKLANMSKKDNGKMGMATAGILGLALGVLGGIVGKIIYDESNEKEKPKKCEEKM